MTHSNISFDDWRTIALAVFMALIGYTVMVTVPVLTTALVQTLGMPEDQAGRVWGNDMLGFSAGAIAAAFTVARVNRRLLVTVGIILTVAGNVMCMYLTSYEAMMVLRVFTGIGGGIFTGTAIATLGGSTKPVVAFMAMLFGFAFSSAGQIYLFSNLSLNNIYWFIIATTVACGIFLKYLPERPLNDDELAQQREMQDHGEAWNVPVVMPILCLIAICFTYINIGGYFTYVELAALEDGVDQKRVTSFLTWASILTLAGCALAMLCERFGLFRPLIVALFAMFILVSMLGGGITNVKLAISLFVFFSLWTFVDVFQYSMMGYMDRSGSLVALIPSVQGFGQFVGPNIAASILSASLGYGVMFVVSSSMALIAMFIYIGMYRKMG